MKFRKRVYIEDYIINNELIEKILKIHKLRKNECRILRHRIINRYECDVVIKCKNGTSIGIELKILRNVNDLYKVIEQAIKRRFFFNYMYIVVYHDEINISNPVQMMQFLYYRCNNFYNVIKLLQDYSIGLVFVNRNGFRIFQQSTYLINDVKF